MAGVPLRHEGNIDVATASPRPGEDLPGQPLREIFLSESYIPLPITTEPLTLNVDGGGRACYEIGLGLRAGQPKKEGGRIMTIVAISREMGSGGYEIGAAVAKALNFEYVNRQILLEAAHAHGVPEATLVDVVERRPSLWERFDAERRRYLTFLEAAYYAFAERGNLVTASRSGPFFVRDVRHALKVRIMAPVEVRVRRVMAQERLDQKAATAKVRAYDREMSGRIDYLFGVDWTQPENYDLVINTSGRCLGILHGPLGGGGPPPAVPAHAGVATEGPRPQPGGAGPRRHRHGPGDPAPQCRGHRPGGPRGADGHRFSPAVLEAAADVAKRVPGVASVSCETVEIPRVYPGPIM